MKRLIVLGALALSLTACGEDSGEQISGSIRFVHDAERSVGCWYFDSDSYGSGLFCLPDAEYAP